MNAEQFFNNGFGADVEKVHRKHVIDLMTNFAKHYHTEQCTIPDIRCSTIFKPTMKLRWLKTEVYIPELDEFKEILQQCWLDEHGNEIWEDELITKQQLQIEKYKEMLEINKELKTYRICKCYSIG